MIFSLPHKNVVLGLNDDFDGRFKTLQHLLDINLTISSTLQTSERLE